MLITSNKQTTDKWNGKKFEALQQNTIIFYCFSSIITWQCNFLFVCLLLKCFIYKGHFYYITQKPIAMCGQRWLSSLYNLILTVVMSHLLSYEHVFSSDLNSVGLLSLFVEKAEKPTAVVNCWPFLQKFRIRQ